MAADSHAAHVTSRLQFWKKPDYDGAMAVCARVRDDLQPDRRRTRSENNRQQLEYGSNADKHRLSHLLPAPRRPAR